jgi:K+-transporting ATPase ATPase C chain
MLSQLRPAFALFIALSLLTGIAYPLAVTGIAQGVFADQANGSLITKNGTIVGSSLIGQDFSAGNKPGYFWGRPSATSPVPYAAFNADALTGSSGSNLGPTNPALADNVKARIDALRGADAAVRYRRPAQQRVPVDLVTSSASGLDPHISIAAVEYQLPRVAQARGMTEDHVRTLVKAHTISRQLGLLGEPVVHVLELNLALDGVRK